MSFAVTSYFNPAVLGNDYPTIGVAGIVTGVCVESGHSWRLTSIGGYFPVKAYSVKYNNFEIVLAAGELANWMTNPSGEPRYYDSPWRVLDSCTRVNDAGSLFEPTIVSAIYDSPLTINENEYLGLFAVGLFANLKVSQPSVSFEYTVENL